MTNQVVFLLLGLANGAVYASLALALVVTFRSSGVINFACGSIALFTAYLYGFLRQGEFFDPIPGLPVTVHLASSLGFWPAVLISLAVTAVLGLALYVLVFRPLRSAPPVARAVASIGVTVLLTGLLAQRVGANPVNVGAIFPSQIYQLGKVHVSGDRFWFAVTVVLVALTLSGGYRFTRFGLHTRASAETEKGALVSGISPDRIAAVNWMIGSMVAGLAGILIAPLVPLTPTGFSLFIVPALAAAILGRFQAMAIAVAGGLAIGMLQSEAAYLKSVHTWLPSSGMSELIPLALILIVLIWRSANLPGRGELIRTTLGQAPRPGPLWRPAVVGAAAGVVALVALHGSWRAAAVTSVSFAIITLSQVVVTGYAGQVSLMQLILAGCAGFFLSPLTETWGVPFPIAPILAAGGAMLIGVVVGLPAVRIRGLPLAAVTLSLAVAVQAVWFDNSDLVSASGKDVKGPSLFGLDLRVGTGAAYPRLAFCLMALAVLIAVALSVAKLRTSRLGAAMLAVRANERSAAAAGINVVVVKLGAIAIAAFIAGIGGTLLAYQQTNVSSAQFDAILGLGLFATAYTAGVTSVSGGILAGMLAFTGIAYYLMKNDLHLGGWYDAIAGLGLILTVIFNPEGIVGPIHLARAARRERRRPPAVMESETKLTAVERAAPAPRVDAPSVLSIRNLTVRYSAVSAVSDVSFDVPEGAIVGLIGPNGAGKTSLIDAVTGFASYGGTIALAGRPMEGLPAHQRIRAGLGRTFQAIELWDDLTVGENIGVGSRHRLGTRPFDVGETLGLLGIAGLRDRTTGELSQGQRQLVSIARSLLSRPKVLLLDEPAAGLDTNESLWLAQKLRDVRDRGVTILLVDHDMGLVLGLCDEIRVLNFGVLIASGTPDVVRADAVVSEAYLGSTHSRLTTAPSGCDEVDQPYPVASPAPSTRAGE